MMLFVVWNKIVGRPTKGPDNHFKFFLMEKDADFYWRASGGLGGHKQFEVRSIEVDLTKAWKVE